MVNIIIQLSKYEGCLYVFLFLDFTEIMKIKKKGQDAFFFASVWYNVFGNKRYSDLVFLVYDSSCGHSFV